MKRWKKIMEILKCLLKASKNEQDIRQWEKDDGRS
ncbi:hypothetical protein J2W41_000929 [Bacillus pumilus]|nr:hypothetical protein [Bacillus pumilus]SNV11981.1 Uncharacterised protein [Bacillus pumilus]